MLTILIDVVSRQLFNNSSVGLQELEWHFHGALFLLSMGFTYLEDAHVRVDLFREKYSDKTKRLIEIFGCVFFLIPYCVVVAYFGIDFALKSFFANEMSATSDGLSYRWVIKSMLPIGFLILGLSATSILLGNKNNVDR